MPKGHWLYPYSATLTLAMNELLAESPLPVADAPAPKRHRCRGMVLTMLLTTLFGGLAGLFWSGLQAKQYAARVKLAIHYSPEESPFPRLPTRAWYDRESKFIFEETTLLRVVQQKHLAKRWNLDEDEPAAVRKLQGMAQVFGESTPDLGTGLLSIEVSSANPQEAAELANAVSDSYEQCHRDFEKDRYEKQVRTLIEELDAQEKWVAEKHAEMLEVMKKYAILDGTDGARGLAAYEADAKKLELQWNALNVIKDGDELMEQGAAMELEGAPSKDSFRDYRAAKLEARNLEDLGLGPNHPKLAAARSQAKGMAKALTEGFKSALATKIQIARDSLQVVAENQIEEEKNQGGADQGREAAYLEAKKACEEQQAQLNEMQERVRRHRTECGMPLWPISCLETARPSDRSFYPNKPTFCAVGAGIGLILGLMIALIQRHNQLASSHK